MTKSRRILLNIIATYGRSLYSMLCGLFSARWVLMALGQDDFGLYGVMGGMVFIISFINGLFVAALSRYYAVSVGKAEVARNRNLALLECRQWFSTAVLIHFLVPTALMLIGVPLGLYVIHVGWIAVPPEKIAACTYVFCFACMASFIAMVIIPFSAMYTAKQRIAELTIYSFITTTLNVIYFCYMASHPGIWLVKYAFWMALMTILPSVIISIRACIIFPECKLLWREMFNTERIVELASYAGWQFFGGLGYMFKMQGIAILLNRHTEFGEMRNSSMSVANQISSQADTLSSAMVGAFQPAIANAYGANDLDLMRSLAFRTCKFGTLLSLIFAVPLALELDVVLKLWLRNPPIYAFGLGLCVILAHVIDRTSTGHMLAVNSTGRIAKYQAFLGTALMMSLPLSAIFIFFSGSIYAVGVGVVISTAMCAWGRVWFARSIVGMRARDWLLGVMVPISLSLCIVLVLGYMPHLVMGPSFARVIVSTILCEMLLLPMAWWLILDANERVYVASAIRRIKRKVLP